jgi:hypothetical protein
MVKIYYDTGRPGTANALLGMVGGSLFFQLIVVYAQNHNLKKNKWKIMFIELLSIITFLKPGEKTHVNPPPPSSTNSCTS